MFLKITKKMIERDRELQKELKDTKEAPTLGDMIMGIKMINVAKCECGSHFAPVYWNEKKQMFTCKLCVGYPDDSHLYKRKD